MRSLCPVAMAGLERYIPSFSAKDWFQLQSHDAAGLRLGTPEAV